MIGTLVGVLGTVGSKVIGVLIAKLLTEKVLIKVSLILLEKLVKSTKNKLDDELFIEIKKSLDN